MYLLKKIWNPEIFQGKYKKRNYFEGWYYKLINQPNRNILAVIPGISYGKTVKDAHAFIQVIDAVNYKVYYFTYDVSDFEFNQNTFEFSIGGNFFTNNSMSLNLQNDAISIRGILTFDHIVPFPKTLTNPGIMGPYSFIPLMECYHAIVNIHHEIRGRILVNNEPVSFEGGYGYIEKDWGHSFPESWIWLQSNHFEQQDVSIMFSIAKIPWFNKHFTGFISFLKIQNKIYRFATYTKAKIKKINFKNNILDVLVEDNEYKMYISAEYSEDGVLKAPKNGVMSRDITESISATVNVGLYNGNNQLIFEGKGVNTGMEIAGDIFQYIK